MKENFINKFLNKIKLTINDQLMKDFAKRFTTIKNNNNNNFFFFLNLFPDIKLQ